MNIRGINKTSLIDFPGKISTLIFTGGCNLRCGYCHNPDLALNSDTLEFYPEEEVLELLKKRRSLIDGLAVTGGEPTILPGLENFLKKVKDLDLLVKLDSNGLKPEVIDSLIKNKLVDFFAIDVKTSPDKYNDLTQRNVDFDKIKETFDVIRKSDVDYEIRTTCIPGYITLEDLHIIKDRIGHVKAYCLQQYVSSVDLIDEAFRDLTPYPVHVLHEMNSFVQTFSDHSCIRGI